MTKSPLDESPNHESLKVLRDTGALSTDAFWEAIRAINQPEDWARWAARLCLLIGSALSLAAVVYFFAYNWDALGRLQKLGLLQAVTIASLIAGQRLGFQKIGGQLLLMAAAVFVGVSFAVFGQVYQTGADAFSFFGMWALCILPWVIAGNFAPLWILWLTLVNLSAWFFWDQVGQFHLDVHYTYVCTALTVINGSGLLLREVFAVRCKWLEGPWLRHLLLLGTLTPLLIPALDLIFNSQPEGFYNLLIGSAAWLLCLGTAYLYFTRQRFDSTALCLLLGYASGYWIAAMAKLFDKADLYDNGGGYLVMALIIGGITALDVRLLRRLKRRYGPQTGSQT